MHLSKDCLNFFAKLIEAEIGIVYSEVNHYQLESRLEEISRQVGLADANALWEQARSNQMPGATKMLLLDIATNNETMFFRDQNVFRAVEKILADAVTSSGKPFKVWSAACSTGQEMLSVAMLRSELAATKPVNVTIFASDISERVLARAKAGIYTQLEVQRGLSAPQLIKYFEPIANRPEETPQWSAKSVLREGLSFKQINLLQPWTGLGQFDLILCRNVLIYQTVENKRKVVAKLEEHLSPDGVLILGGAESLVGISDSLAWQDICGASVYRKRDSKVLKAS